MNDRTTDLRRAVLMAAQQERGCTVDELVDATGKPHQTVSAEVSRLAQRGVITATHLSRPTRYGRPATVYVVSAQTRERVDALTFEMRQLVRGEAHKWDREECDEALLSVQRLRRGKVTPAEG
jgi:predicted ArsR family transcriptional regulator